MKKHNPYTNFGLVPRELALSVSGLDLLLQTLDRQHPAPPFGHTTDIWLTEAELGAVTFAAVPSATYYNPMGTIHGGWTSMLLDTAMACAIQSRLAAGQAYTTLEIKVNFVRPIFESTGKLTCKATLLHFGSRTATSEGKVFDAAGNLLAHGTETGLIL